MSKRAIIFDFDGTIADSFPAVIEVFEDITKQPKRLTPQQIAACKNLSGAELMKLFKIPRWKVPYLFFKGRRIMKGHMDRVSPHDGMPELVRALYAKNVPLYIISTNSVENIEFFLEKYDLKDFFRKVYGNASAFAKARSMLKLIDAEGLDVQSSWYVGDETRDISAAKAVGLKMASVSWGYNGRESLEAKQPDALIDTVPELKKVLRSSWKK